MKTQKIKISELDDDLDTEASLKCMNMKKTLGISVDKNQKIKLKIDMKNNEIGTDYILVCLLNGNQISINNKDYMTYSDDSVSTVLYYFFASSYIAAAVICSARRSFSTSTCSSG